ncbi:TraR/DksA family transcriptional regulator [Algoriphagus persicinus]|uniref:TraR/DksA family transcriptional regulator n=1 Tax=Algoriphagus persicinus TaxID=3108754 RepID=UPI002B3D691A|nr:TraR/DksA C4-type zinc finger protein [Algoriphagus sp. E1-3-M2]MEB2785236.1 TraR/DksA C4-type zinc finger protein [Algoriphagus sp. E1-3-M2]
MNSALEQEIRTKIQEKILAISEDMSILKEHTAPQALDSAIGRISRMDFINNRSINEAQIKKNEAKLRGLHNWLGKLGTAEFGKCIRCGQEININRLLFMPESNHCIKCAR